MKVAGAILLAVLVSACADEPELSCVAVAPIHGVTPAAEMAGYADQIVTQASELHEKLSSDEGLAGFTGSIAKNLPGSDSRSFASELRQLERLVALQTAREQATLNDGPPLVDPSNPSSCQMLAVSIASLDQGQSTGQLLRHIKRIEGYFGPDYSFRESHGNLE